MHLIPILTPISLIKTLKDFSVETAKIKWFNDITIENKKIAGILCEAKIEKKLSNIIVGIGININSTRTELDKLDLFDAASIFSATKKEINPKDFLKIFLKNFDEDIKNFIEQKNIENTKVLIELYETNCQTIGQQIKVYNLTSKEIYKAKAIGLEEYGNLLISRNSKIEKINYNDFSISSCNENKII